MIKRGLWMVLALAGLSRYAWSDAYELMPIVGYQFNGGTDLAGPHYDRLDFKNAALRGFSFGYINDENAELEFSWTRAYSSAEILKSEGVPSDRFDVRVDRLHLQGLYMFETGRFQPFFLIGIGGTRYTPSNNRSTSTKVSGALGGGMKWYWNDHVGLRFDGRWTPILSPRGSHYFCDENGSGECYSTESNSLLDQYAFLNGFEFTTGLLIRWP